MAYQGYLIKIGQTVFPLSFIYKESYEITPNRRQDLDPFRDADGVLHRNVVKHRASTIKFDTKPMYNKDLQEMMSIIRNNFINEAEKKVLLTYYSPDIDDYKSGEFYIPDVSFTINLIDTQRNRILYNSSTIEFIEY